MDRLVEHAVHAIVAEAHFDFAGGDEVARSGRSNPAAIWSSVVLPTPEGPTSATSSPSSISSSKSRRTCSSRPVFCRTKLFSISENLDQRAHKSDTRRHFEEARSSDCSTPYSITTITAQNTMVQARTPATFCELNSEFS